MPSRVCVRQWNGGGQPLYRLSSPRRRDIPWPLQPPTSSMTVGMQLCRPHFRVASLLSRHTLYYSYSFISSNLFYALLHFSLVAPLVLHSFHIHSMYLVKNLSFLTLSGLSLFKYRDSLTALSFSLFFFNLLWLSFFICLSLALQSEINAAKRITEVKNLPQIKICFLIRRNYSGTYNLHLLRCRF